VRALAEASGRSLETLGANDIGFALAPRLNAAGRLEDMAVGVECLLTDDPGEAGRLAALLDGINIERRELQQQMVGQAQDLLDGLCLPEGQLPPIICLHDEGWHPGVIGLVASRIKEQLHRPVLACAPSEPGSGLLRGSARSIPGFHVRDALAAVDARHPGLIERFGGHAMAAGLTLPREHLDALREALVEHAGRLLDPALLSREVASDGPLQAHEFTRELAEQLRLAGPWGQGFPEPVFDNVFELLDWRVLGERHLKMRVTADGLCEPLSAIHFGAWQGEPPPQRLRLAYQLDLDDYRGRCGIQLLVRHMEAG
jgi:single-stranded-DNA-specific exonuclease